MERSRLRIQRREMLWTADMSNAMFSVAVRQALGFEICSDSLFNRMKIFLNFAKTMQNFKRQSNKKTVAKSRS